MPEQRWYSVDEIAAHLSVKRDTVYDWIKRKNLPGHKLGRVWRFDVAEVDAWVRSGVAADDEGRSSHE